MISWPKLKIRDVTSKVGSGATPSGGEESYKSAGIPLIRSMNIHFDGFRLKGLAFLDEQQAANLDGATVKANDVLLNITGASIGRVTCAPHDLDGARVNQHVCIIRPHPALNSWFLAYFLASPDQQSKIMREQVGATRQGLTKLRILDFDVPVPPDAEQSLIVSKIDELFSDLDAGVAALQRVRANLKRYRASVLNDAVTGRLTRAWRLQNPPTDTSEQLLRRICERRKDQWEETQLRRWSETGKNPPKDWRDSYLPPPTPDALLVHELPVGWAWATLSQIGAVDRGRSRHRPRDASHLYGGPYPFVQTGEVGRAETFITSFSQTYSEAGLAQSRLWPKGTLCITIAANIAETAILGIDACFPDSVVGFSPASDDISVRYVELYFRTVQKRLEQLAPATAQKNLNVETLSQVVIPIPPPAEQEAIVTEMDRLFSIVRAVEAEVEHGLKRAARLRQAILKRAFEGKLVPQIDGEAHQPAARTPPALATSPRRRGKRISPPPRIQRKHRKGIAFYRGAVMSYAVHRLCASPHFGRIEAMKTMYLTEAWLGIDLELEPVREKRGPLDVAIYKVENLAKKLGWFNTKKSGPMIRYSTGPNIGDRLAAGKTILGDKLQEFDRLLSKIEKMDTDSAELFATTFAVWNDLLLDEQVADDAAIITGIHGWHLTKAGKFPPDRIVRCINWMKQEHFVPKGMGPRSTVLTT